MKDGLAYYFRIVYIVTLFLAMTLIVLAFASDTQYLEFNQSNLHRVELEGTIQAGEKGREMPLSEEAYQQIKAAEYVIVKGHFTEDIEVNEQIFVYLRRIRIKFYQNNELIYEYGQSRDTLPFSKTAGNIWGSFYSKGISKNDAIRIEFENPYPQNSSKVYQRCIEQLYTGDKMQLFMHMAAKNVFSLVAAAIILLMGVEMLCISVSLRLVQVRGMIQIFYCGLLFLVSSIWLMIDYTYISLIMPYGIGWEILDTFVFIGIPLLAIRYARSFMITRMQKLLRGLEAILLLMNFIYIVLQTLGIVDGEMMQEAFREALPYILSIVFVCLLVEMRKNKKFVPRLVLSSGNVLIIFALIGCIQYKISEVDGVSFFGIGFTLFVVVQYVILIYMAKRNYERAIKARQMKQELVESKMAIMLSQIQPHFLYNSISSIQELCLSEPKKAHDALAQFAHFLRGNMDSLSSKDLIPFEQELKHVKNYLALEEIRFEERLNVEYKIEKDGFFLPPLTLQPIVENAVRYGISKKREGGTITICTKETEKEIIITVLDDGVGFDVNKLGKQQDNRSHIGMENVKNRLNTQCNGRMEIESRIGEGTKVCMFLPK